MDLIPIDVCEHIISFLNINEKRQLSLVSYRWYELVTNHSMYSHIMIKVEYLEDMMIYFDKNPPQCQQVRSLLLETKDTSKAFCLALPERFPNLQEYVSDYALDGADSSEIQHDANLQSWEKITRFHESNANPLYQTILESGAFVNLTRLEVCLFGDWENTTQLVLHLYLAPKLKHLSLSHPKIGFNQLEVLHQHAPLLETLCLSNFTTQTGPKSMKPVKEGCKPAPKCLTTLTLDNMQANSKKSFVNMILWWAIYIAKKYAHVKHLTLNEEQVQDSDDEEEDDGGKERKCQEVLSKLLPRLRHLETYNINISPLDWMMVQCMDAYRLKLKSMTITDESDDIEDHMGILGCSNQVDTLESMSIYSNRFLGKSGCFGPVWKFAWFAALRHLEIHNIHRGSGMPLLLQLFIQYAPHLESFKATSYIVQLVSSTSTKPLKKANWKSLELSNAHFHNAGHSMPNHLDLMDYVAHFCPALERLVLDGSHMSEQSNLFKVEFPHRYFKTLEVTLTGFSQANIKGFRYFKVNNLWYKYGGISLAEAQDVNESVIGNEDYASIMYEGSTSLKIMGIDVPNW